MRRMIIVAASLVGIGVVVLVALWRRAHIDLESHIRDLVGPQAVDCGYVPVGQDRARADSCALVQFRSLRPFWVRYEKGGVDSTIEWVFLRAQDGRLVWLSYDSDTSGSGSPFFAEPRVSERPCAAHVIDVSPGHQRLTCQ